MSLNDAVPGRSTPAVAVPRDAATVILLRQSGAGLQSLLLQRRASMAFAGGEWVFPGGAIDPADGMALDAGRCLPPAERTVDLLMQTGAGLDRAAALRMCVAACRETFEESGVLLARHSDGRDCSAELLYALQNERAPGGDSAGHFAAMLEQHDLQLELDRLVYWSNWITPAFYQKRFDTRFFAVAVPNDQHAAVHAAESQQAEWLPLRDPDSAPRVDPPITSAPTLYTLREMAREFQRCGSLQRMLEITPQPAVAQVMIKMMRQGDSLVALLPWDAQYAEAPGPGIVCDRHLLQRYGEYPSRVEVDPSTRRAR